jgi:hypothetical protein
VQLCAHGLFAPKGAGAANGIGDLQGEGSNSKRAGRGGESGWVGVQARGVHYLRVEERMG